MEKYFNSDNDVKLNTAENCGKYNFTTDVFTCVSNVLIGYTYCESGELFFKWWVFFGKIKAAINYTNGIQKKNKKIKVD